MFKFLSLIIFISYSYTQQTFFNISSEVQITNSNTYTITFNVSTDYDIYGYQFDISNISLTECIDNSGLNPSQSGDINGTTILGFSFSGQFIPSGSYELVTCQISEYQINNIIDGCLSNFSLAYTGDSSSPQNIPEENIFTDDCLNIGCDGAWENDNSHLIIDNCGICGGYNNSCTDCNGQINPCGDGSTDCDSYSFIDGCGNCVGGNTGEIACIQDCNGVDGGNSFINGCGDCVNIEDQSCIQGCDGNWSNSGDEVIYDDCGVCGGDNSSCLDCNNVPNGSAVLDCAGVCNGLATEDLCGNCNGSCNEVEYQQINCDCDLIEIDGIETIQCSGNCSQEFYDNPCYSWNYEEWTDEIDPLLNIFNGVYDLGESFIDINNNQIWDKGCFDCLGNKVLENAANFVGFKTICESYDNLGLGLSYCYDIYLDNDSCTPLIGCTDLNATNYDELHLFENQSCIIEGCTDSEAENYNADATFNDGTCLDNSEIFNKEFSINYLYPNPFNPSINLYITVDKLSNLDISVYTISGRLIDKIHSDFVNVGFHSFEWIPDLSITSGNYIIRVTSEKKVTSKIITYIK